MKNNAAVTHFTWLPLALLIASGCQTTPDEAPPYPAGASRIPFTPQVRYAPIQAGEGAYPNLFAGTSHAVWDPEGALSPVPAAGAPEATTGPDGEGAVGTEEPEALETRMEGDLEAMPPRRSVRRGPLVIMCTLESQFPDRSIAYDAVGLRGMDVALRLPDGEEVLPVQRVLDPELGEVPVGALRRYNRKLTLHFPRGDFMVENPAANPAAGGIRLVINGLGSTFYFEWHAVPDTLAKTEPRADYKIRESVKKGYRATSKRVKAVSHTFD